MARNKEAHPFQMQVLRSDTRFGYAVACPADAPRGVVVVVHDSERRFLDGVHAFTDFAARHRLVIVAPLFPPNVLGDEDEDGYKFLLKPGIRYDLLLLDMVRAAQKAHGLAATPFLMHGYSGGAQFVHRFALLHPQQVRAVSVASPGEVTIADDAIAWWGGVHDAAALFDSPVQWDAVATVAWHLAVGELDVGTRQLEEQPPSAWWSDEQSRLQSNRKDRLQVLRASLEHHGARPDFELLVGVEHHDGHQTARVSAQAFFSRCLAEDSTPAAAPVDMTSTALLPPAQMPLLLELAQHEGQSDCGDAPGE